MNKTFKEVEFPNADLGGSPPKETEDLCPVILEDLQNQITKSSDRCLRLTDKVQRLEERMGATSALMKLLDERVRSQGDIKERLVSVMVAAEYLGRTVTAVREMIWAGKLPYIKSDKRIFLDRVDLDSYISTNKRSGKQEEE